MLVVDVANAQLDLLLQPTPAGCCQPADDGGVTEVADKPAAQQAAGPAINTVLSQPMGKCITCAATHSNGSGCSGTVASRPSLH
jgi:hypothetical protein